MRFWFSGPRVMGIRPGVSFGREDFAALARSGASYGKVPLALSLLGAAIFVPTLPVFAGALWLLAAIVKNMR